MIGEPRAENNARVVNALALTPEQILHPREKARLLGMRVERGLLLEFGEELLLPLRQLLRRLDADATRVSLQSLGNAKMDPRDASSAASTRGTVTSEDARHSATRRGIGRDRDPAHWEPRCAAPKSC